MADKCFPKDFYTVKNGHPSTIVFYDTIQRVNSEKWTERTNYTFKKNTEILVKKFKNDSLIKDEKYHLDSKGRIVKYVGDWKHRKGEWFNKKLKFSYEKNKKIIEQLNTLDQTTERCEVHYNRFKDPTRIETTIVGSDHFKLEDLKYDYINGTYIHLKTDSYGNPTHKESGVFNVDYVIEKNEFDDITKMYWITSNKKKKIIYHIDYEYDISGNWIKKITSRTENGVSKKIVSKAYRTITYKN